MPPRDDEIHLPPEDERAGLRELHDSAPSPRRGLVLLASAGAVTLGLAAVAIAAYTRPPAPPEETTVIAAPASPIKTRPEHPGGEVVRNQDLHVNALMERPAPPPVPRPSAPPPAATPAAETIRLAEAAPSPSPTPSPPPPPTSPQSSPAPAPQANPGAPAAQSLRIVVRDPETEAAPAAPSPAPTPPPPAAAPTGPARAATAPPQGVRVQIGAFRTAEAAESGWAMFSRKHPAMARDRNKVVTRATVDGTEWRRLQITGFADRTAAEAYCRALRPTGQACMVVSP